MKKRTKLKLEFISFICLVIVLITVTLPLLEGNNKAQVLAAVFGAIGVGATLVNFIKDVSNKR